MGDEKTRPAGWCQCLEFVQFVDTAGSLTDRRHPACHITCDNNNCSVEE